MCGTFVGIFFFRLAAMVCHNESPHVKRHNGPRKKRHSESSKLWKTVSFTVFTLIVFIGYATPGYCMCCIKKNISANSINRHIWGRWYGPEVKGGGGVGGEGKCSVSSRRPGCDMTKCKTIWFNSILIDVYSTNRLRYVPFPQQLMDRD